jgi:formylglycine-generating enzyme required for sulfatase activity
MTKDNFDIAFLNNLLVEIPSGEVELRDDRIKHKWKIEIKPFSMGKFPVTQDLYYQVTNQNPSEFINLNKPVETVSWKDAVTFCNALSVFADLKPCYDFTENNLISFDPHANGFRLPTEAEWQFACQGGSSGIRYDELDEIAWYKNNSDHTTHEVGQKKPNQFGLYDMLGNVWEWCSDIYDESVYGSYRILRGGGWCDHERSVMATTRRRSHPISFKIDDLGFRIAKNI